jgi:hypothetical protein
MAKKTATDHASGTRHTDSTGPRSTSWCDRTARGSHAAAATRAGTAHAASDACQLSPSRSSSGTASPEPTAALSVIPADITPISSPVEL